MVLGEKEYMGILIEGHLKRNPDSQVTKRRNIFIDFCNHFGRFDIHQVTKQALKNWFNKIKVNQSYTGGTLYKVKAGLNHFFNDMVKQNVILENPLEGMKFKKDKANKKRPRVILPDKEIEIMLRDMKIFSSDILYPYVLTLVHTGARRNEVRKLKWKHIDFELNRIHFTKTKTGRARSIKMSPVLRELMETLHKSRPHKCEYVYINQWDYLLSDGQMRDMIIKFQKLTNSKKLWRPHDMRHSFAHNYLKRGGKMYALQAILGHKRIDQTIDQYGQLQASDVEMVSPYF